MVNKSKEKSTSISRIKTGIHGLDDLLQGGFVKGSSIVVSGGCGSGKTLFSGQFLCNGATMFNEPGVFLSLEERPDDIRKDLIGIGLNPHELEKQNKLRIKYMNPLKFVAEGEVVTSSVSQMMKELVKEIGAKRVVLDSTGAFELYLKHKYDVRQKIYEITQTFKDLGVTAILISEVPEKLGYSRFGVEEFVCDGVIALDYLEFISGGAVRSVFIRKMRRTQQGNEVYSMDIDSNKGVTVKPVAERFSKYLLARYRSVI